MVCRLHAVTSIYHSLFPVPRLPFRFTFAPLRLTALPHYRSYVRFRFTRTIPPHPAWFDFTRLIYRATTHLQFPIPVCGVMPIRVCRLFTAFAFAAALRLTHGTRTAVYRAFPVVTFHTRSRFCARTALVTRYPYTVRFAVCTTVAVTAVIMTPPPAPFYSRCMVYNGLVVTPLPGRYSTRHYPPFPIYPTFYPFDLPFCPVVPRRTTFFTDLGSSFNALLPAPVPITFCTLVAFALRLTFTLVVGLLRSRAHFTFTALPPRLVTRYVPDFTRVALRWVGVTLHPHGFWFTPYFGGCSYRTHHPRCYVLRLPRSPTHGSHALRLYQRWLVCTPAFDLVYPRPRSSLYTPRRLPGYTCGYRGSRTPATHTVRCLPPPRHLPHAVTFPFGCRSRYTHVRLRDCTDHGCYHVPLPHCGCVYTRRLCLVTIPVVPICALPFPITCRYLLPGYRVTRAHHIPVVPHYAFYIPLRLHYALAFGTAVTVDVCRVVLHLCVTRIYLTCPTLAYVAVCPVAGYPVPALYPHSATVNIAHGSPFGTDYRSYVPTYPLHTFPLYPIYITLRTQRLHTVVPHAFTFPLRGWFGRLFGYPPHLPDRHCCYCVHVACRALPT